MTVGGPTKEAAINFLKGTITGAGWTDYTPPFNLALVTAVGDYDTAGTELTGGSYAQQSLASKFPTPTDKTVSSNADVSFTGMPDTTTSGNGVVGVEIYDSNVSSPIRVWFGSITEKLTNSGDTLTFSSGNITAALNSSTS